MSEMADKMREALAPHLGALALRCENPGCGRRLQRPWFSLPSLGVIVCSQTCKEQVYDNVHLTETFHEE